MRPVPAAASVPRTDWAHLPPIRRSVALDPPVTFHGDRFGASVAGARQLTASTAPRRGRRSRRAPSGIMLDAARVETITVPEPVDPETRPGVPPVLVAGPRPAPVHRRSGRRSAGADLLGVPEEMGVAFAPAPPRHREPPTTMSWTADGGFDGSDEPAATPAPRYVPTTAPRHERTPWAVAALVKDLTGVDVGDTVIDRSHETSDRAASLGAVAFTEAGTVHLPAELGDLDEPRTRAVLAHELTHAAQQRRRGGAPPDEASDEGIALEAEARSVQHAARRGVRPHVLRRSGHVPRHGSRSGVQRLPADDPYAWQDRDDEVTPDQTLAMTGMLSGYSVRPDSAWGRRIARDEQQGADFEARHAARLVERRNARYAELLDRERARHRDLAPDPTAFQLDRRQVLAVRAQLDREMPFEHGVPEGHAAFPDQLPDERPPADDDAPSDTIDAPGTAGGADTRSRGASAIAERPELRAVRPVPGLASTPSTRGRTTGASDRGRAGARRSAGSPGRASSPGSSSASPYEWQAREPTAAETVATLFGGGLFGDLLGRAVGQDTDEDRAGAERERLPQLIEQRQLREQELRHRRLRERLRERLTVEAREEIPEDRREAGPIELSPDDIVDIRVQIDRELPLEFAIPEYLPADAHTRIGRDGSIPPSDADSRPPATGDTAAEPSGADEGGAGAATDPTATGPAPADATSTDAAPRPGGSSAAGEGAASGADRVGVALAGMATAGNLLDRSAGAEDDQRRGVDEDVPEHDRQQGAASTLLSAASEHDIDALSRQVWSRIRREMRTELLIDRERAGVLADLC